MRRGRETWVQIIEQFEKSGLTQEQVAEGQGIPVAKLPVVDLPRSPGGPRGGSSASGACDKLGCAYGAVFGSRAAGDRGRAAPDASAVRFPAGTPACVIAELVERLRGRC